MTKEIKKSHEIAWGYGLYGLMWLALIVVQVPIIIRYGGIPHPTEIVEVLKLFSGIIIYLCVMSSVNIIMAIAVWKIISFSQRAQRVIVGFAIFFAASAAINLIATIASWFLKKMPDWYSPFYGVFPAALLTFSYGYFAYALRKIVRTSDE